MQERLQTLNDVMARLGVTKTTVYRLINDGAFPKPIKVGKLSRWHPSAVEEFIAKGGSAQ